MQKGFTLAELLACVGIIGLVAAISIPAVSSLRPDKTKVMYLKTYDTLAQTVKNLASNSKLYAICHDPTSINASCSEHPLINTDMPIDNQFHNDDFKGDKKLCNLIAESLGIDADDTSCKTNTYSFDSATFYNQFKDNISFTTTNGFRWYIVPAVATNFNTSSKNGTFQTDVYVDINPQNNNKNGVDESCIYNQDTCTNPDIFKFMIAADGQITPADPKGITYIETRKSFIKKDKEILDHSIKTTLSASSKTFSYELCGAPSGGGGSMPGGLACNDFNLDLNITLGETAQDNILGGYWLYLKNSKGDIIDISKVKGAPEVYFPEGSSQGESAAYRIDSSLLYQNIKGDIIFSPYLNIEGENTSVLGNYKSNIEKTPKTVSISDLINFCND